MEEDGPVSEVQVRLAKGEINIDKYREIVDHLKKNISPFQRHASLKILQTRYAKSELSAEQYHEKLVHLIKNLYLYPRSAPFLILHERYAKGEITSADYAEMCTNLNHEGFPYDESTPLWILNNRYARCEINTEEYEEILDLFNDYSQQIQQTLLRTLYPAILNNSSSGHSMNQTHPSLRDLQPSQILSFFDPQVITHRNQAGSNDASDQPCEEIPVVPEIQPDNRQERPADPLILQDHPAPGDVVQLIKDGGKSGHHQVQEPGAVVVGIPEKPEFFPSLHESRANPELKPVVLSTGTYQSPSLKFLSSQYLTDDTRPSESLSLGVDQGLRMISGKPAFFSNPENRIMDTKIPVSSPGGLLHTGSIASSRISLQEPDDDTSSPVSDDGDGAKPVKTHFSDLRLQVKTLLGNKEYDKVIKLADNLIREDETDCLPFFYKGMARYYLNAYQEALEDLDHARDLSRNPEEIRKINVIRQRIFNKQRKKSETGERERELSLPPAEMVPAGTYKKITDRIDILSKQAQDLIEKADFRQAWDLLSECIELCNDLPQERHLDESVDEIYSAMGYVRYQLRDYYQAKEYFQKALNVNPENEDANQFMKDILIRAVRKK
jgi:uncharacterized membrane protein